MSRLWRSFPPVFLLLWLSKWLRGLTLTGSGGRGLHNRYVLNESRRLVVNTKPLKPLKGKSKRPEWNFKDGEIVTFVKDLPEPHDYEPTEFKKPTKRGDLK